MVRNYYAMGSRRRNGGWVERPTRAAETCRTLTGDGSAPGTTVQDDGFHVGHFSDRGTRPSLPIPLPFQSRIRRPVGPPQRGTS